MGAFNFALGLVPFLLSTHSQMKSQMREMRLDSDFIYEELLNSSHFVVKL